MGAFFLASIAAKFRAVVSFSSLSDLLSKNALLKDFKAVQSGDVWVTDQNMYQQMMQTGRIIADFNKAIIGSDDGVTYVHRLG